MTSPGGINGSGAWIVTELFSAPADVLPLQSDDHIGMELAPSPEASMRVHLLTEAAILEAGADIDPVMQRGPNPSFCMAGQYPDRAGQDGVACRVRDEASTTQPYGVFASGLGFNATLLPFPAAGPNFGRLTYQAAILTAQGTGRLTNGAGADDS